MSTVMFNSLFHHDGCPFHHVGGFLPLFTRCERPFCPFGEPFLVLFPAPLRKFLRAPNAVPCYYFSYYFFVCSLVSTSCYPYTSGADGRRGDCSLHTHHSRMIGAVQCPAPDHWGGARVYHASPPYRIAANVRENDRGGVRER